MPRSPRRWPTPAVSGLWAGGYLSAGALHDALVAARVLTGAALGVNLFVPSDRGDRAQVEAYAEVLRSEADRLGVGLGEPRWDDDAYDAKLEVVQSAQVHLVSFTFGCPASEIVDRLHRVGTQVAVTVTSVRESQLAVGTVADLLVVQGAEAGGHQGSFVDLTAKHRPLLSILAEIRASTSVPLIATGAIMSGRDAAAGDSRCREARGRRGVAACGRGPRTLWPGLAER